MLRQLRFISVSVVIILGSGAIAGGQDADATLAFTFSYSPKTSAADLASGYKKHLEWHTARSDPILWYGWFVIEGDRLGHFIDGAYDVTGAEFDARPDPAGDAADATENFLPVAQMQYRRIYRLRRDLGTSSFLEDRSPSSLMQVVYYHVYPGAQLKFEAAASAVADASRRKGMQYALYEMLTGTSGALYTMYVPLTGFESFDSTGVSLESVARTAMSVEASSSTLADLAKVTISTNSEVWRYRADLSLIPEQDQGMK